MAGRRTKRTASRRASSKKTTPGKKVTEVRNNGSILDLLRFSESYTSLILGIFVVIIASVLLISFLKGREFGKTPPPAPEISAAKIEPLTSVTPGQEPVGQQDQGEGKPTIVESGAKGAYTVQAGDDLWHIAEKVYKDGYKWTLIAKANNITNPGMIFSGNVLTIPNVSGTGSPTPTVQAPESQQEMMPAILGNSYKVQHGDSLWSIAERRYKNGYRWVDIAKANNLTNPDFIHSENILQLPN